MMSTRSMGSKSGKRKPTNGSVLPPRAKHRVENNDLSRQQLPPTKLPSPPRQTQERPVPPSSSAPKSPTKPVTEDADAYDATNEHIETLEADTAKADALVDRICSGIAYMQQQHSLGKPILQTTYFQINISNTSSREALALLRRHATLIASAPTLELFEIGIPRPDWVAEGALPGLHDPQWWVGKSPAEIKAGPFAEEADVGRAAAYLKGMETKKGRKRGLTTREKENERKLIAAKKGRKKNLGVQGEYEGEDEGKNDGEVEGRVYVHSF